MELFKKAEGKARLRVGMCGGVPLLSNELLPPGARSGRAITELDRHRMQSIGVENEEFAMAHTRICAWLVGRVAQLYA